MIKGEYEGGGVLWECSLDVINYLQTNQVIHSSDLLLDLGCGQGLVTFIPRYKTRILSGTVGIYAAKKFGCSVHFNDYNEEVIENHLMDALFINNLSSSQISASSGDWKRKYLNMRFISRLQQKFEFCRSNNFPFKGPILNPKESLMLL